MIKKKTKKKEKKLKRKQTHTIKVIIESGHTEACVISTIGKVDSFVIVWVRKDRIVALTAWIRRSAYMRVLYTFWLLDEETDDHR